MNIISKICGDVSNFVRNRLLRRELKDRSNVIARREAPRQSSAHRTGEWIASPGLRRTRNDREKCGFPRNDGEEHDLLRNDGEKCGFPRNDGVMRGVLCDIKQEACFNVIARREAPRQSSAHRTGQWIASPGFRRTRNDGEKCGFPRNDREKCGFPRNDREKCGFPRNDGVMRGVLCDIKRKACFNVIARREAPRQSMRSIKKYAVPALCLLFAACDLQGPWSYWPEDEKQYRGVYTLAYVIADRPVNRMCFQRLLSLNEAASDNFAFYDSATVKISGNFSGRDTTLSLAPESAYPNCFDGPADLLAERGKNYSLDAYFVWDSSGKSVRSHYTAEATVPSVFAISSAFAPDMHGKYHEIHDGDTAYSLSYPNDLLTYKFHPE